MTDYGKRMREGSPTYRLGRLNRRPYRSQREHWTDEENADYERGKRDRAKAARKAGVQKGIENVVVGVLGTISVIVLFLFAAILRAFPFILVLIAAKLIFF